MSPQTRVTQLKWRLEDALVATKRRVIPSEIYQSPPSWVGYLLISPGVLLVSSLFVGLLILTWYSFLTFDPFEFIVYELTTESWTEFLTEPAYYGIFWRTLSLSALITVLSVGLAFPYAYLTIRVRSAFMRKTLLVGLFVPFFTGIIVRAYGWLIVLGKNGLVNAVLGVFGIGPVRFIGTKAGVVIGLLQIMIPYAIIMLAPAIQSIDRSLERAAQNLGANPIMTFRTVVIPLAKPGIAGASIVVFTITSATFAIPGIIGAGRVDFMANLIFKTLFSLTNYPLASSFSLGLVAVTSTIILIIFYLVGTGTLGISLEGEE